uniref:Uncharacterized protein n=1 Tax=Octopus bimaculoides TaxID=37653 RepID=A0A0L8FX78_OCTBM
MTAIEAITFILDSSAVTFVKRHPMIIIQIVLQIRNAETHLVRKFRSLSAISDFGAPVLTVAPIMKSRRSFQNLYSTSSSCISKRSKLRLGEFKLAESEIKENK